MSAKQVSLKTPATIAVVVVLLVGVVFLNVDTFGGAGSKKSSRGYRVQAHPPVPMDAGHCVASKTGLVSTPSRRVGSFSTEELKRDPFYPLQAQPKKVPQITGNSPKKGGAKRTKTKAKPLKCSAIMLGGVKPMAIINGEGRHPGDKIRGMILTAIDADGVTLRKSSGSRVHLPVGLQESDNQSFRVVTRTHKNEDQGRTRLVDQ